MSRRRQPGNRSGGFTLIELVMVIMLLSIAALPIAIQFTQMVSSLGTDREIQTAAQLAQAGAEQTLGNRRLGGYASVPVGTTTETLGGNFSGYVRTTTVSAYSGAGCPVSDCRLVEVEVSYNGTSRSLTQFMLADY
ncbi:type II secretion system protein [Thiohalobacter sp. IOR34]|uniref:type II secretion system protein n=1 Tax=Thiohalobacter sp. IOR34 TaxID=3057176 RepID=UPI0025B0B07E|nr:type II secretion system protein [Thiohalobacter sp. IOR34]WJW75530.1 type II secretion system protein [Thiohalobacter sp. IOR34]